MNDKKKITVSLKPSGLRGGSISPAATAAIAQAIQKQEGYAPGTLAYRNNNPGNLRFVGQPGATQGEGGFAKFATYDAGYQALQNQIQLDATRGTDAAGKPVTTLAELIGSWAPPNENDTGAYIISVSSQTGFDPNAPLSSLGDPAAVPTGDSTDTADTAATGIDIGGILSNISPVYLALAVGGASLGYLLLRKL
jgi:hypothetical protein